MNWVTVHHPESGGQAVVAESAVPQLEKSGWKEGPLPATKKDRQAEQRAAEKEND